jgi:hypothetical protein
VGFNRDRRNEPVATAGQGFYESRVLAGILQRLTEAVNGFVQALIEIHEGISGPQPLHQLIASDQLARMFHEEEEDLKRLILKIRSLPVGAQFARARVQCELTETDAPR